MQRKSSFSLSRGHFRLIRTLTGIFILLSRKNYDDRIINIDRFKTNAMPRYSIIRMRISTPWVAYFSWWSRLLSWRPRFLLKPEWFFQHEPIPLLLNQDGHDARGLSAIYRLWAVLNNRLSGNRDQHDQLFLNFLLIPTRPTNPKLKRSRRVGP